jgi:DNA repair photolyase
MTNKITGTYEWSVASVNSQEGCKSNCSYCYARKAATRRGITLDEWVNKTIVSRDINRERKKFNGVVMYPTRHDIFPCDTDRHISVLQNLLSAGNDVLIVSKPSLAAIRDLLLAFPDYRDNIMFRFTMTSPDDKILDIWEPGAPRYKERFASLVLAYKFGYKTSISIEPMLDVINLDDMISDIDPYVTDSIWIGKMNKVDERAVGVSEKEIERIKTEQKDDEIWDIYETHRNNPKIRWKESIKRIIGLDLAAERGEKW